MFSLISSKIVKYNLSLKSRSNLVQKLKTSNLVNLPNEILGEIISGLDIVDLLALCKSNIHLENLCSDEYFLSKVQYKLPLLTYIQMGNLTAAKYRFKYIEEKLNDGTTIYAIYEVFVKLDDPNIYNNHYNDALSLINTIFKYTKLSTEQIKDNLNNFIFFKLFNKNKIHSPYYSYQFMINEKILTIENIISLLINEDRYDNNVDPNREKILQIALSYPINIDKLIDAVEDILLIKLNTGSLKMTYTYYISTNSKYLVLKYILDRIHISTEKIIAMFVMSYLYFYGNNRIITDNDYFKNAALEIFTLLARYIPDDYRFSEIDMVTIINHIFTYNINGLSILNDLTKYFNIINNNILIKYIVDKILSYIKYSFINIIDLEEKFAILKKLKFDEEILRAVIVNGINFTHTDDIQCPPELCNIEFILSLFGIYE